MLHRRCRRQGLGAIPTSRTRRRDPRLTTPCSTPAGAQTATPRATVRASAPTERALTFDDEVELVLVGVVVDGLGLTGLEAVQPQQQPLAPEERRLEEALGAGAGVVRVVREVAHRRSSTRAPRPWLAPPVPVGA